MQLYKYEIILFILKQKGEKKQVNKFKKKKLIIKYLKIEKFRYYKK